MPYRFDLRDASLSEALRRIAGEEIASMQARLGAGSLEPGDVHGLRKSFKKLRALLRLVRHGLPEIQPAENVVLRDAARSLSGQRDAAVRIAALDRLMPGASDPALLALRAHLVAEAAMPAPPPPDLRDLLAGLALRVNEWELQGQDRRILAEGLSETRSRARRAMRAARDNPDDEVLHDWRKRAKDHWYQARLFLPVWPDVMRPIVTEADRLGEALGDHHDLAMLQAHLDALPDSILPADTRTLLADRSREARQAIEATAFPLGARLFAGDPEEMADLWIKWWKIWLSQIG